MMGGDGRSSSHPHFIHRAPLCLEVHPDTVDDLSDLFRRVESRQLYMAASSPSHYNGFFVNSLQKGKFLPIVVSDSEDCPKRFTLYSLADLFNHTPSRLLWEAFSHAAISSRIIFVHIYSSLSRARYSFVQLSELEQCRMKTLAQGFIRQHRFRTRVLFI